MVTDIEEGGAGVRIVTDIKVKGRNNLNSRNNLNGRNNLGAIHKGRPADPGEGGWVTQNRTPIVIC